MSKSKCKVNSDGSVSLEDILTSFNSSIREEHAWALCYQCAKFYKELQLNNIYTASDISHVYLQTDGQIHEKTTKLTNDKPRKTVTSEKDIIVDLGVVIYTALNKKCEKGEERVISQDLELLISDMVSDDVSTTSTTTTTETTETGTDDEGIERDAEECSILQGPYTMTLDDVIKRCENHLGTLTKIQAESHYKAVVRAFVTEALELSTFLDKVAQGKIILPTNNLKEQSELDKLKFSDWTKFWVQVMNELRMGVKLKKVNYSKAPIEYELTPYEILMKDIRSCKYNLRKIMINGNLPSKVTKDAHAIILEFIRSRPPLKKVSDRKLPPQQQRNLTPREQLLNSIKKGRKLKPTPRSSYMTRESSRYTNQIKDPKPQPPQQPPPPPPGGRRLIKVDFSQFDNDDDDNDDDVDDNNYDSPDSSEPGLWSGEYLNQSFDGTLEAYDLATQDLSRSVGRRHTLEVCDPNMTCYSVPQSRPGSRQSCNSSEAESVLMEPEVAKAIQDDLISGKNWEDNMSLDDRLSLTLSEIVHIRAVLTKAELETLPIEGRVRYDVESRKVCFLCLKTRFGIFGPWGQRCTLCKRTICSKCFSKMNIPMEYFSSVPVVLLSPSIMCTPSDEEPKIPKNLINNIIDDKSPLTTTTNNLMTSSTISDPGTSKSSSLSLSSRSNSRSSSLVRASRVVDKFNKTTNQMIVCHDCKLMVLQIIKSARANRSAIRNKTLQSLTLNLPSMY